MTAFQRIEAKCLALSKICFILMICNVALMGFLTDASCAESQLNDSSAPTHAPSFDCNKATTLVETTICGNLMLSRLDNQMARAYKNAIANSAAALAVKARQRDWLTSERNACTTLACLIQTYEKRLTELSTAGSTETVLTSVSGQYERYFRGKPDENSASITIVQQSDGRVHISGDSEWIRNVETGNVNIGQVEGIFPLEGDTVRYSDKDGNDRCSLKLTFLYQALLVEDRHLDCGGMNVTFGGDYRRVGPPKSQ